MLVIISDLHLRDGTLGATVPPSVFQAFLERLRTLAYQASWREDGTYRPIEKIDLVLLGDVFDYELSSRWHEQKAGEPGYTSPCFPPDHPALIAKTKDITRGILRHNAEFFRLMRRLSQGTLLALPISAAGNRHSTKQVPVRVRIFYMLGNHDWVLGLGGEDYTALRQEVITHLGLANSLAPFPHDPADARELWETLRQHRVFARHGDIFDPLNYDDVDSGQHTIALGGAMTIALLSRFPLEVKRQLGNRAPPELIHRLGEIKDVYPPSLVPLWVNNTLAYHVKDPVTRTEIKAIWNELAYQFQQMDCIRAKNRRFNLDLTDMVNAMYLTTRMLSFGTLARLSGWITDKLWPKEYSLAKHAANEPAFRSHQADFVVYGHTHIYEIVPLEANYSAGRIYINTGSWQRFYYFANQSNRRRNFIRLSYMTGVAFYKDGEREGHPFDSWIDTCASWKHGA